jgi:hypothetical protein
MPDQSSDSDWPPHMRFRRSINWLVILPLFIAVLSLGSSIFQSWNYARNIDSAQRNVLRAESLRTCRDIIDVFFQFRLKAEEANRMQEAMAPSLAAELKAIAYKFGAFGTFLANFQDDATRTRYTELAWELLALADGAHALPTEAFAKRLATAEGHFGKLNDDCVKAAQSKLL